MFKAMMHGWIVVMMTGLMGNAFAETPSAPIPPVLAPPVVAPPAVAPVFVIKGDSVYEKRSDLTWARCSVGQQWKDGAGCVGSVKTFTFDEAQQQGSGEWRVPTRDELGTLVDHGRAENKQKPTIDEVAFPNMDLKNLGYWTSTPASASGGWDVYFYDGSITGYYGYRSNTLAVRLVRDGH